MIGTQTPTARADGAGCVRGLGRRARRRQGGRPGDDLGPAHPVAPAGVATPGDKTYAAATTPTININGSAVMVFGAALAPGSAGLYQIAIQVPGSIADGDYAIQAVAGGIQSPTGVVFSIRK